MAKGMTKKEVSEAVADMILHPAVDDLDWLKAAVCEVLDELEFDD